MKVQVVAVPLPPDGSFGALVRASRRRAFLSQEQLAERAELSERTVRNLEAGRVRSPRADTVRLLADALELSALEREGWFEAALCASDERGGPAVVGGDRPVGLPGDFPARMPMRACGSGVGDQHRRRRPPAARFREKVAALRGRGAGRPGRMASELILAGPAIWARVHRPGPHVRSGEDGSLSSQDRRELTELRQENRRLREDLEVLMRAAAILATVTR